jgi:porphobilinogen synthase
MNPIVREMVAETRLSKDMFIYPYFIVPGVKHKEPISAMPGIYHFSIDELVRDVGEGLKYGINKVLLFGVGEEKSDDGSSSYASNTVVSKAILELKRSFRNDIYIITDVCVCAYTSHGHCGIIKNDYVDNDASLKPISNMALAHAKAGADMVAPSDMMDGRVGAIRQLLDQNQFCNTGIMSYAIKFASSYYGPFREAADSAPGKGDRKTYQMDYRNGRESMKEAELDEIEGSDILMVKPALAYMDVISNLSYETNLPIACYNVSGEYSMVKAAASSGMIDERQIVMENMHAFARAGSDIVITYHARDILEKGWL